MLKIRLTNNAIDFSQGTTHSLFETFQLFGTRSCRQARVRQWFWNVILPKEFECEQLTNSWTFFRIRLQHGDDHFGGCFAQVGWQSVVTLSNFWVSIFQALCFEWWLAHQESIHDAANRPDVNFIRVTFLVQYFWCNVVRCSAKSFLSFAFVFDACGETEISNLYVKLIVEEQIAQLQIAMNNLIVVKIFHTAHDLMNVIASFVF